MAGIDRRPAPTLLRADGRGAPRPRRVQERVDKLSRLGRRNPSGGQEIMTAPHADQLIDGYLARLNAAAGDLPKAARQELVDDVRAHIAEARARKSEETDAALLNILDRLGEPAVVVAAARERLGVRSMQPYRPGVLEVFAVILVPLFWPVGVILLWMSPAWKIRDKIIGTLVPPGGYLGIVTIGAAFAVSVSGGSCGAATDSTGSVVQQNMCYPGSPWWQIVLSVLVTIVAYA